MKISDVIIKLEQLENIHGDMEVKGIEMDNIYFNERTDEIIIEVKYNN